MNNEVNTHGPLTYQMRVNWHHVTVQIQNVCHVKNSFSDLVWWIQIGVSRDDTGRSVHFYGLCWRSSRFFVDGKMLEWVKLNTFYNTNGTPLLFVCLSGQHYQLNHKSLLRATLKVFTNTRHTGGHRFNAWSRQDWHRLPNVMSQLKVWCVYIFIQSRYDVINHTVNIFGYQYHYRVVFQFLVNTHCRWQS